MPAKSKKSLLGTVLSSIEFDSTGKYLIMKRQLEILFVQLGTQPPSIFWANLAWLKSTFPEVQINLATDVNIQRQVSESINVHTFPETSEFYKMETSPHSTVFRKGYWLHTMRRLLAIGEFHRTKPNVPILQIETDVLLLEDFPFEQMASIEKLAWPPVNDIHDGPALVFTPNLSASEWLSEKILEQISLDPKVTDMAALKRISNQYPGQILKLPVEPPGHKPDHSQEILETNFKGVFDGLTLGRWLTGIDPRNKWGLVEKFMHAVDHFPNMKQIRPTIQKGRLFIGKQGSGNLYPVYNLHVHSKNKKLFSTRQHSRVLSSLIQEIKDHSVYSFSFLGFIGAIGQLRRAVLAKLLRVFNSK